MTAYEKRRKICIIFHQKKTGSPNLASGGYSKAGLPYSLHTCLKPFKGKFAAQEQFVQHLKLKAYSASTLKTYRNEFLQLLQVLKTKPVYDLTTGEIKCYMAYAREGQGIRKNTAHSRLNALKFYFEQVLGREKFFWEIPRPKKPFQLPKVLNEKELQRMFASIRNLKHKALLFTAYSAGLRVSEVVHLKLSDIDSDRMQIRIESAKGKKDPFADKLKGQNQKLEFTLPTKNLYMCDVIKNRRTAGVLLRPNNNRLFC